MNADYESLLAFRKTIKGKPDIYEQAQLTLNQIWIDSYKYTLFHNPRAFDCTCRRCEEKRQEMRKSKFLSQDMVRESMRRPKGYI